MTNIISKSDSEPEIFATDHINLSESWKTIPITPTNGANSQVGGTRKSWTSGMN